MGTDCTIDGGAAGPLVGAEASSWQAGWSAPLAAVPAESTPAVAEGSVPVPKLARCRCRNFQPARDFVELRALQRVWPPGRQMPRAPVLHPGVQQWPAVNSILPSIDGRKLKRRISCEKPARLASAKANPGQVPEGWRPDQLQTGRNRKVLPSMCGKLPTAARLRGISGCTSTGACGDSMVVCIG